jgi:integrase
VRISELNYMSENIYTMIRGGFRCAKGQRKGMEDKFMLAEEFKALLSVAREDDRRYGMEAWGLFALAGNFGLRCSETLDLGFEDFKPLAMGYFRVRTLKQKANQEDRVYTGKDGGKLLSEIVAERRKSSGSDLLFPFTSRTARYLFGFYAKEAGLSKNTSFHSLRHTAARMMLEATGGGDPQKGQMRIVKKFLRHKPTATEIYTEPTAAEMMRAMDLKGMIR